MNSQISNQSSWQEVPVEDLNEWTEKLEASSSSYRQFPYWVNAYKVQKYIPRFFYYGERDHPTGFVAIVEGGKYPFRFGFIDRGPFFFTPADCDLSTCLSSLTDLFKRLDYVFVRFTQGQESVYSMIRNTENVVSNEPYPFCRDSRNSLLVEQTADDDEMISGFSHTARRDIKRALRFDYEIRVARNDSEFERAWTLFEKVASKKGFALSSKPKGFWHSIVKASSTDDLAPLYLCFDKGELIAAQLNVRDGNTSEVTLAALDIEALKGQPSPAALLYWTAMREGYRQGCRYFNIGGPGDPKRNNHLFEYKRKFRPTLHVSPEPLCLVLSPRRYYLWMNVLLRGWRAWRARFGKSRPTPQNPTTSDTKGEPE